MIYFSYDWFLFLFLFTCCFFAAFIPASAAPEPDVLRPWPAYIRVPGALAPAPVSVIGPYPEERVRV